MKEKLCYQTRVTEALAAEMFLNDVYEKKKMNKAKKETKKKTTQGKLKEAPFAYL